MSERDTILSVAGLEQRLYDPVRGDEFRVSVDHPIELFAGDFVSLLGPSGCGKTTLLTVLGLLRRPSNVADIEKFKFCVSAGDSSEEIDLKSAWNRNKGSLIEKVRRNNIGFALQTGELLQSLSVQENIAVPLRLNGVDETLIRQRVADLIASFGLKRTKKDDLSITTSSDLNEESSDDDEGYTLADARVNKLSGGEFQRVVLARAIAHNPDLIFVDEPTAALNQELARRSLGILKAMQNDERRAVLMITHDEDLANEFSNVIIRMAPVRGRPAGHIASIQRND